MLTPEFGIYLRNFQLGFTYTKKEGEPNPQHVVCLETLLDQFTEPASFDVILKLNTRDIHEKL